MSNQFERSAGHTPQDGSENRVVQLGLAEASYAEPVQDTEKPPSKMSSGLIRAGIGGAVVLLAVIGLFGLINGFGDPSKSTTPQEIAAVAEPEKTASKTADPTTYKSLVTDWTLAKTTLDNALTAGHEQQKMNSKDQGRIEAQTKRQIAAAAAVDAAGVAVADALQATSAARDSLDDLLGEKLNRKLQLAKEELNAAILTAEAEQKNLRAAQAEQKRYKSTLAELRKAEKATKASAAAAQVVAAAAKSAQLVMAENEDILSGADSSTLSGLESGFFKNASLQAESASRSALITSKAVSVTERRLDQSNDRLKTSQKRFKDANKAEEVAYLNFAAADKIFKLHKAKKEAAQDKTEVSSVALASAERRLEEKKDLLDRETATLLDLRAALEAGQTMSQQHDIKVAAAQTVFDTAEVSLRTAQRQRSISNATTLAELNAELHDKLRAKLGNTQASLPVYDRFVLSSEALFEPGSARLGKPGQQTLAQITGIIEEVTSKVPEGIDWMLRVDGHTDSTPLSGNGGFKDNWELSQARALSVVKHLIKKGNIPARNMSANGFGEYQPISTGSSARDQAADRRIEIVLTSR